MEEDQSLRHEYEATHDHLTGLLNRRGFENELGLLKEVMPGDFAVLYVDLDNLKPVNETLGHAAGDALLQSAATTLISSTVRHEDETERLPDIIGRLGGDEFAIGLPHVSTPEALEIVKNRLLDKFAEAKVSASIGGRIHQGGEDTALLMHDADKLMQAEKARRKTASFESLPKHKQLIARLGICALRYAGVNPPRQ
jgi:diguanylate cyclase (GGDEF)-like protein